MPGRVNRHHDFLGRRADPGRKQILARVQLPCINEAEARQLTGKQDLLRAGRAILALGPGRLVIKRGEYGALLVECRQRFVLPASLFKRVVDPTSARDSFAGGMMGYLAVGSTMASFVIEDFSLDPPRRLHRQELHGRLQGYEGMLQQAQEVGASACGGDASCRAAVLLGSFDREGRPAARAADLQRST